MTTASSVADWGLLGQDPAPGDPDGVRAAAASYRAASARAAALAGTVAGHAAAADDAWSGGAAEAYSGAVGRLGPEVSVLADAAESAAAALDGHANALQALQDRAEDVLEQAASADQDRRDAAELATDLEGQRTRAQQAYEDRHLAWRAAEREADAALAAGDGRAATLQSEASRARVAVNDALADLARVEADLAAAHEAVAAAEQRLQSARADAEAIAMEARTLGGATAALLSPVPPLSADVTGGLAVAAPHDGPVPPPPAPPAAAGPRPHAAVHGPPTAGGPPTPPDPRPLPDGPPPVAAEDMVRIASMLAVVRMTRMPVAIDQVRPTLEEFRRQQRRGLQDVTARGAAMARALGFDGVIGGLGWRPTPTDHSKGLAIDLMTYDDVTTGQALADFYRANHEELGVTYVIWNGQICSSRMDWAWRPYTHPAGRTDPTAMHLDHVHVSFDPTDNGYACACFGVSA